MHQTSKFPFTFISEANCQVSNAEKIVNKHNKMTCWLVRLYRVSVLNVIRLSVLWHVFIKDTQLTSCNI